MEIDWAPPRAAWPDGPLQQDWAWGDTLVAAGAGVARAWIGGGQGAAQVLRRRIGPARLSLISRGPVWQAGADRRAGFAALRRVLGGVVVVTADAAGGAPRGVPLVTPVHVAELSLDGDLRAAMAGKWRNRLARAERSDLRVAVETDAAWLAPLEMAQARARGYRGYPPQWSLAHPGARLVVVRRGGVRLAAMLFLRHGDRATYQIGWSGPEGRAASAHALCLWHAMTLMRGEGARLIDLGTVDTTTAPGLARFKIGAGARVRPLGPTVWLPPLVRP